MAKCEICEKDMLRAKGCVNHLYIMNDNTRVEPTPVFYHNVDEKGRCVDCGAKEGQQHHIGCDQERCSVCGLQYIGCDCDYSDSIIICK